MCRWMFKGKLANGLFFSVSIEASESSAVNFKGGPRINSSSLSIWTVEVDAKDFVSSKEMIAVDSLSEINIFKFLHEYLSIKACTKSKLQTPEKFLFVNLQCIAAVNLHKNYLMKFTEKVDKLYV